MTTNERQAIIDVLSGHPNTFGIRAVNLISELKPDLKTVVADMHLDVRRFAAEGHCKANLRHESASELLQYWDPKSKLTDHYRNGSWQIEWNDKQLLLFIFAIKGQHCDEMKSIICAEQIETALEFFVAFCEWIYELDEEVLVFDQGEWEKSAELHASISSATLDNLILESQLKAEIENDFRSFFASKGVYDRYGVPWKRGVLLFGDPGNGKTHSLKALINALGVNALYVRSFAAPYATEQACISQIFERARQSTPCLLIFEDLDSLVTSKNRSYFLNELDGFASNSGIFVVASTNHPERLDPAIIDRPSRFDRKYHFALPTTELREQYLQMWEVQVQTDLKLTQPGIGRIAALTDGFSYAYLKELCLSSIMAWVNTVRLAGGMEDVMVAQVEFLRLQMAETNSADGPQAEDEDDDASGGPDSFGRAMYHMMRRTRQR